MFIDEATIRVEGGRGGNGVIRFISNPHNWRGGPDGGSGGDGGAVRMRATESLSTLQVFQRQSHFRAASGVDGGRNGRQGRRGEDTVLEVPAGTLVRDARSGELLADLAAPGDEVVLARGGEGGRGNQRFVTSTRQAPRICERGDRGEVRTVRLELQLLADVGIIGYPNVGKSSLLSRISGKQAKVADYPFTTLVPNLGVVDVDGVHQFVAVDIPGLIEGAHRGKGLGDQFLRHARRTRALIHLVDLARVEGRDPLADYHRVNEELAAFSPDLGRRPQVVAGNKVDLMDVAQIEEEQERFSSEGVELVPVSVATGRGVRELVGRTFRALQDTPMRSEPARRRPMRRVYRFEADEGFRIDQDGDVFVVRGRPVEQLAERLVLESRDAQAYLFERLERMGVIRELERRGCAKGSAVRIGGVKFELEG
jgi:GTPase